AGIIETKVDSPTGGGGTHPAGGGGVGGGGGVARKAAEALLWASGKEPAEVVRPGGGVLGGGGGAVVGARGRGGGGGGVAAGRCGRAGVLEAGNTAGGVRYRWRVTGGRAGGWVELAEGVEGDLAATGQALVEGRISPEHAQVIAKSLADLPDGAAEWVPAAA